MRDGKLQEFALFRYQGFEFDGEAHAKPVFIGIVTGGFFAGSGFRAGGLRPWLPAFDGLRLPRAPFGCPAVGGSVVFPAGFCGVFCHPTH